LLVVDQTQAPLFKYWGWKEFGGC